MQNQRKIDDPLERMHVALKDKIEAVCLVLDMFNPKASKELLDDLHSHTAMPDWARSNKSYVEKYEKMEKTLNAIKIPESDSLQLGAVQTLKDLVEEMIELRLSEKNKLRRRIEKTCEVLKKFNPTIADRLLGELNPPMLGRIQNFMFSGDSPIDKYKRMQQIIKTINTSKRDPEVLVIVQDMQSLLTQVINLKSTENTIEIKPPGSRS